MIEYVNADGQPLAIIIRADHRFPGGLHFLTHVSAPLQLAGMSYPKGHEIQAHEHKPLQRTTEGTQEILMIRRGLVYVEFFDRDKKLRAKKALGRGDTLLLLSGGHGFYWAEDSELLEIKTGPYLGPDEDKVRW